MTEAQRIKRNLTRHLWRLANPERWAAILVRHKAKHPDAAKIASRRYRERHPGKAQAAARHHYLRNREAVAARGKAWRLAHPERCREYTKVWQRQNVKQCSAYMKQYRNANPEWLRVWNRNLKLRRKGVPGQHRPHHVRLIYASQEGLCYYCSTQLLGVFQIDHMVPVARGGTNWPSNLCCACGACNQAKRAMTAEEFLALQESLSAALPMAGPGA